MGQYFMLGNLDKKEYVNPWDIHSGAKWYEWAWNASHVLMYLIRKSDEGGGGDIALNGDEVYAGRWAGDRVILIGDYDTSKLYEEVQNYTNISIPMATEFNRLCDTEDLLICDYKYNAKLKRNQCVPIGRTKPLKEKEEKSEMVDVTDEVKKVVK